MTTLLTGSRVALRPVERHQVPVFAAWFREWDLLRQLMPGVAGPFSLDAEEVWYQGVLKATNAHTFAIHMRDVPNHPHEGLIGSTSLMSIDGKNRSAVFGIAIGDPHARGKGYGREAIELILEYGFLELNLNRIELSVFGLNERARKLYEAVGFKREGDRRQALFREGRYWDVTIMSILRGDYVPRPHWTLD